MATMIAAAGQRLIGWAFDQLYVNRRRYAVYDQSNYVDQHQTPDERATGFDWSLYQVMASDRARVDAYRKDIATHIPGRTVLEIGPGPHATLTLLAAEAGAASVLAIEANAWAAAQARRRVERFAGQVRVVTGHSDNLDEATVPPRQVDVLLLECYHAIGSQERVVETVQSLRDRGWSFGTVISKGFRTFVAPAAGPTSAPMTVIERRAMGWPAEPDDADRAMAERPSSLHGDMAGIAQRRLAAAQAWQWCDLAGDGQLHTAGELRFRVPAGERFAGLQFFNQFEFDHGVLDTGETPTSWGVYYVPVPAAGGADTPPGPGELVLRTGQPDPERPSVVVLEAQLGGVRRQPVRL